MFVSRRNALLSGLAGGVAACSTQPKLGGYELVSAIDNTDFNCGVASGDPARESVVLWTRIAGVEGSVGVVAEVAEDEDFSKIVWTERTETGPARDHTVKVVAAGLTPGKRYAYRFLVGDKVSPIGFTKTLPETTERVRFAIASCSHFSFGYFNAYDHMARDNDIDAVLHLGDYFYEYGVDGYGGDMGQKLNRPHDPPHEVLSLDDYRRRHRQYKTDAALQAMHGAHPVIPIWDDHETSNDSFQLGAENHQPATEGSWEARKRAALQAYYEYMPVRDPEPGRTREQFYRDYAWGDFLTITAVETRLTARSEPVQYQEAIKDLNSDADVARFRRDVLGDPSRELLGDTQRLFVEQSLAASVNRGATWRVMANQILMARVLAPDLGAYVSEEQIVALEAEFPPVRSFLKWSSLGLPYNTDAWDGYPAARERFYQSAKAAGATDLIVLTGDTHMFWANDLKTDAGEAMGVEFGTSGITSPGAGSLFGDAAFDYSLLMRRDNDDVRYVDAINNGYTTLELRGDKGRVEFISMDTITSPSYTPFRSAGFNLRRRNGTVELAGSDGLGFKEWVLYR
ncbi:MAG: alkaline phosphatase D family protein [Pseudomonadota bacterium]